MADYCWQCTEQHLGVEGAQNDLKGLTTAEDDAAGNYGVVLCEGCGPTLVDSQGRCAAEDCLEHHGKEPPHGQTDR